MTRTKITALNDNRVTVTGEDFFGDVVTTEYFTSAGREPGGTYYVRIDDTDRHGSGQYPQVCDGLRRTGPTLMICGTTPLIDLIRQEYRRGRRMLARELAR